MHAEINVRTKTPGNLIIGQLRAKYSAAGDRVLRYYIDFRHTELDLHKEVSAPEIDILQNKVDALMASWDKKLEIHKKRSELTKGKQLALEMEMDAEAKRSSLRNILQHTLGVDDKIDWEVLKDNSEYLAEPYSVPRPKKPLQGVPPSRPEIGFFQKLFGQEKRIKADHTASVKEYEDREAENASKHWDKVEKWTKEKARWEKQQADKVASLQKAQKETNAKVENLKQEWQKGNPVAILEHANIVLEASDYNELISREFEVEFDIEAATLLIEYTLPSPDKLPTTRIVRFVPGTGELKESHISAKDKKELYDDVCYQVCLRTIHEIFEADTHSHIQRVLFNGTTSYVDKRTGQEVVSTILSVMVNREEFQNINLARIEPKLCFKSLKGVSAASLVGLSPIAPIMELNKNDKRFVEAKHIDVEQDSTTNLAAMHWEEFEHLVRQLFEKEFSSRGGEANVTRASSDGGVDVVAFDPDPISGGKIIIQAKRYTNTVGVAAVRDLYGAVVNEGANKGILVTTSDYGPDAYKFSSDKPITLMTGSNLLHLLEKHGIRAKIDIAGARKELGLS